MCVRVENKTEKEWKAQNDRRSNTHTICVKWYGKEMDMALNRRAKKSTKERKKAKRTTRSTREFQHGIGQNFKTNQQQ